MNKKARKSIISPFLSKCDWALLYFSVMFSETFYSRLVSFTSWPKIFVFFSSGNAHTCTRIHKRNAENQNNSQIIHIWPRISLEHETLYRHEDEVVSQTPCCHIELIFATFIVQQVEHLSVSSYMLVRSLVVDQCAL